MKRTVFFISLLLYSFVGRAQQPIEVDVANKSMSMGQQMAVSVLIPEARAKQIIPLWDKYVNKRSIGERLDNFGTQIGNIFRSEENKVSRKSLKMQKKGDEWLIRGIQEPNITSHLVDVYAKVSELPQGCKLSAFFQFTDSVFMSESNIDEERLGTIKAYLYDFGVEAYKSVVDDQIADAKKELSKQQKVAKKIESSTRKAEKSISGYESDIQEYQAFIPGIQNNIKRIDDIIETKKPAFSQMTKDNPDYDSAKAVIKDFEKDKSNNFKKIRSLNKKIKSREMDIKSAKRKISNNEQRVNEQEKVIAEKEMAVNQLEQKRDAIK